MQYTHTDRLGYRLQYASDMRDGNFHLTNPKSDISDKKHFDHRDYEMSQIHSEFDISGIYCMFEAWFNMAAKAFISFSSVPQTAA